MSSLSKAIYWLASAVRNARHANERTRKMVAVALAKLSALLAIQRAAQA
jgi:hypothetical protein